MPRAFSLIRVSTAAQAGADRYGPEVQDAANKAFIEAHGWEYGGTFADTISGKSTIRQSFEDVLAIAKPTEIAVFANQKRLARDVELSYYWLKKFTDAGLDLYTVDGGSKLKRGLEFGIRAVLAEADHEEIVYRMRSGILARGASGKPPNGVHAWGYEWDKNTDTATLDPAIAAIIRQMFERAADNHSYNSIGAWLESQGIVGKKGSTSWSPTKVSQTLRNPIYKGQYSFGKSSARNKGIELPLVVQVPPVVDPDLWQLAQRGLTRRKSRRGFFTGYIFCGLCGKGMSLSGRHLSAKRYDYYRCNGYLAGCRNTVPAASIHALEPQIRQAVADFEYTPPTPNGEAEAQLERLQDEEQRWLEAYRARVITLSQLAGYKSEIDRARAELVVKTRVPVTSATVRQAAHTMALRQLLQLASVQIVATREAITVQVFAS